MVATRTFPEGTELRLRAVPGANERFIKWKEDNRTNVERTVTMSNAITLTPLFEKKAGGEDEGYRALVVHIRRFDPFGRIG
mgnify:CR=1 FL=1